LRATRRRCFASTAQGHRLRPPLIGCGAHARMPAHTSSRSG
jgi:hypothetical protein